jgi:ABC-type cobalamin/Fe3+-siderophores transport system ATPase subunit
VTASLVATGVAVERGRRRVLDGIDLELRRGEVTVLLGPNGAGKSTLLGAVAGAIPLAAGQVEVEGRVAAAAQGAAFARRSVRANVELALAWWGLPRPGRRARADEALSALGVAQLSDRHAHTLSGGEARRVHLARVLAVRPDVLLLDEPTSSTTSPRSSAMPTAPPASSSTTAPRPGRSPTGSWSCSMARSPQRADPSWCSTARRLRTWLASSGSEAGWSTVARW